MKHLIQPLTIRDIEIPNRIVMSPMSGYSDYPFRKILAEVGGKVLFSEMVHTGLLIYGNKKTQEEYLKDAGEEFFAVQIVGSKPDWIKKAAYILSQKDGFRWIDINMGCPVRKIVKEGAGAALMQNLDNAKEIIKAARSEHKGILSVKMRTGWSKNNKTAPELARIAEDEGIDLITIHGRTREEFYTGPVDIETIAQIKKDMHIPVMGNGGLMNTEDVKNMVEKTGVDGVMIARGAFGNPWIFKEIEAAADTDSVTTYPDISEKKEVFLRHAEYIREYYGEKRAVPLARKMAVYYFKGIKGAAAFRNNIYKVDSYKELYGLVDSVIDISG
ncbi:MAG: tRNA dihydrouridine synthase DusB [Armatimonadota bacterium]